MASRIEGLGLALATIVSWGLCFLRGASSRWYYFSISVHIVFCTAMSLATTIRQIFPVASNIPLEITFLLTIARTAVLSLEPNFRQFSLSSFMRPESSRIPRSWRRVFVVGLRTVWFVTLASFFLDAWHQDVYEYNYDKLKRRYYAILGGGLEMGYLYIDMDGRSYLPFTEFAAGYAWQAIYADAAINISAFHVISSFSILEIAAWVLAAFPILLQPYTKRYFISSPQLPRLFVLRWRHFILAQVIIELTSRKDPQLYADRTIFAAFLIGLFHSLCRSYSLTFGASHLYTVSLHYRGTRYLKAPTERYYAGVIPVEVLYQIRQKSLEEDALKMLHEVAPYTPNSRHKVVVISYKHQPPYNRQIKISHADLTRVEVLLEKHNCTHVWVDFAQNVRSPDNSDSATWFEEGVAPYIEFEVFSLWEVGDALTSMWLRIEEMGGLLGKGLLRAPRGEEEVWEDGLHLSMKLAILQLGARASVGEFTGCRRSYNKDIDAIAASYGKSVVQGVYDTWPFPPTGVPDGTDDVYHSQITVNVLIPLAGLMETNWVRARGGLLFPIWRRWGKERGHDEIDHDLGDEGYGGTNKQFYERYRNLTVFANRKVDPAMGTNGDGEERFSVICEACSWSGIGYRVESEATVNSSENVIFRKHRWLGEREIDLSEFAVVDREEWMTWCEE